MKYKDFIELPIWNEAKIIVNNIYNLTSKNKVEKDYGFKDQIRRASLSIMNNIAEGFDSGSTKSFVKYLIYSQASCSEVISMLYIALDLDYIKKDEFSLLLEKAISCRKQIKGFIKYLRGV